MRKQNCAFISKIKSKIIWILEHMIEIDLYCHEKEINSFLFDEIDLYCFEKVFNSNIFE